MQSTYVQLTTFDGQDFSEVPLIAGEYEGCTFQNCNFMGGDITDFRFIDCYFEGCNLSLVKSNKTVFLNAKFKDCKILGFRFDTCLKFGLSFSFDSCQLNHSSFYKTNIKKTTFENSQLQEVDFTECDLTGSVFDKCDLAKSVFNNTNLEKVDFCTSYNYSLDPESNRIRKAKFSLYGLPGLLGRYDIDIE